MAGTVPTQTDLGGFYEVKNEDMKDEQKSAFDLSKNE